MYNPNQYVEVPEQNSGTSYAHTNSLSSPSHHLPPASGPGSVASSNLDRVLYNDLVEIVPLIQTLIDRKSSSSFTRRGSMIYTKTPSRDSRKNDQKNKNANKSTLGRKNSDKEQSKHSKNETDGLADDASVFALNMVAENEQELNALKEQLDELRQKISEKDELLKAAETSKNEINSVQSQVDALKRCAAEKDSLIKSSQQQLNDAKIKLADKQAALEKLQWEARTSNQKVERLQEELDSMQSHISSLMILFEGLSKDNPIIPTETYDVTPHYADHLPDIDDIDEIEMQKMEEARKTYVAAVALAKEKQDEESLLAASRARLHLQSFVFRKNAD